MKIATYNIQNIFHRNKALVKKSMSHCVKEWIRELDCIMRKTLKAPSDQARMRELSFLLGFEKIFNEPYAFLRNRGGNLYFKSCSSSNEIKAGIYSKWNGWTEIQTIPINYQSILNKLKVVADVKADVLLLQEIEDRNSVIEFSSELVKDFNAAPYKEFLVLQGNDYRGQELGCLTKSGYRIGEVKSYLSEVDSKGELLFSKNFLKIEIITPFNNRIWILSGHLKKITKDRQRSDAKRLEQAQRVAKIYKELREKGEENIVVAGTLNAVSYCHSLSPLLQQTDLKDITRHSTFNVDFDLGRDATYYRLGAYRMGVNIKQKNYLLLSPALFKNVRSSGLNRRGVWPIKKPQWSVYNSLENAEQAASEHPVVWGEIDV